MGGEVRQGCYRISKMNVLGIRHGAQNTSLPAGRCHNDDVFHAINGRPPEEECVAERQHVALAAIVSVSVINAATANVGARAMLRTAYRRS